MLLDDLELVRRQLNGTSAERDLTPRRETIPLSILGNVVPRGSDQVDPVFSALFGTGGPIYTIYLARRVGDKGRLRATISTLIFVSALARLLAFFAAGVFSQPRLHTLIPLFLPCMLAGLFLGNRLHHRLPGPQVIKLVWMLLLLTGVSLLWRNG